MTRDTPAERCAHIPGFKVAEPYRQSDLTIPRVSVPFIAKPLSKLEVRLIALHVSAATGR